MGSRIWSLTLLVLSLLECMRSDEVPINQRCSQPDFPAGRPLQIKVSNDLGKNVCINQSDTDPTSIGTWHFIDCPGANRFRSVGDTGGATLCQGYMESPGIGIDFTSSGATMATLHLQCENFNSTLTAAVVIDITVHFRPTGFVMYVPQSRGSNVVDATVGSTTVIAVFIALENDLGNITSSDEEFVDCIVTQDASNCRHVGGGSELTKTYTVTPETLEDSREITFTGPSGDLATVQVNVIPNSTAGPHTTPPPVLDVGGIIGLAIGIPVVVLLVLILAAMILLFFIWRVGPGQVKQQGDPEARDGPTSHFNYLAFGDSIPSEVRSDIVKHFKVDEFKLNGSTLEDRLKQDSKRYLFLAKASDYEAASPGSSLATQVQQLPPTQDNRVVSLQLPDEMDGARPIIDLITGFQQQQPATDQPIPNGTESGRIVALLQSMHRMLFKIRLEGPPAAATNVPAVRNGHSPAKNEEDTNEGVEI